MLVAGMRPVALDDPWYDGLAPALGSAAILTGKRWLGMRKGPATMGKGFIVLVALAAAVTGFPGCFFALTLGDQDGSSTFPQPGTTSPSRRGSP